jgi:pimeloyl-ACP methyl ester carboxylesterase
MPADQEPLVIAKQGCFRVGGRTIEVPGVYDPTDPEATFNDATGQSYHVDQLYAEYQIPVGARPLPLVFVHGNNLDGSCWDTTPDGRDGFRTIFVRRGFSVYIVDFPRRGRAGCPSFTGPLGALNGEQIIPDQTYRVGDRWSFHIWRIGDFPKPYPTAQFPRDPAAIDQALLMIQPSHADDPEVISDGIVALLDRIGPAILVTHSQGGLIGWLTAMKSPQIKGIVAYEPTQFVFSEDRMPAASTPVLGYPFAGIPAMREDWTKLARIPIQIVFGDFIETTSQKDLALEFWRKIVHTPAGAVNFAATVNGAGGDVSFLHLPEAGIHGNSHFLMMESNNLAVADTLSHFLHSKGLD